MAKEKKTTEKNEVRLTITPPNIKEARFPIRGSSILVMNKFSEKAKQQIIETQQAGETAKKGKKRTPKDFRAAYEAAKHISTAGWVGIPASAFRCAMISACKMVGFKMTIARMSVFIKADGFDATEGTPLVKITKGQPEYFDLPVRVQGKCDVHPRPMWQAGWEAVVTVQFDADQFTLQDVTNLLIRVGRQVGILEGRPDSRTSGGMGWGLFELCKS